MTRTPHTRPPALLPAAVHFPALVGGSTPEAHPDSIRHVTPHPNDSFISFRWPPAFSFYLIISASVLLEGARVSAGCLANVRGRDNNNNHNNEICLFESVEVCNGTNLLVLCVIGRDWTTSRTEPLISLTL